MTIFWYIYIIPLIVLICYEGILVKTGGSYPQVVWISIGMWMKLSRKSPNYLPMQLHGFGRQVTYYIVKYGARELPACRQAGNVFYCWVQGRQAQCIFLPFAMLLSKLYGFFIWWFCRWGRRIWLRRRSCSSLGRCLVRPRRVVCRFFLRGFC